jgi:hypothetical protein
MVRRPRHAHRLDSSSRLLNVNSRLREVASRVRLPPGDAATAGPFRVLALSLSCPLSRAGLPLSVGVALAVSACGGHAITKKDVIARGDQICQAAASSARAVPPPTGQSMPELARYYRQVTPIVQAEVKQLRALPRPSQDLALLNQYLDAIASSAGEYTALVRAAQNGDRAALASAGAALRSNAAAGLATRYGITECGGSIGTAAS